MSNVPPSLCDVCLTLFRLAISVADPWPFSLRAEVSYGGGLHLSLAHCECAGDGSKRAGAQLCRSVPKGCLAVHVGRGEEQQRFVIPVAYINHHLFEKLLKEAEEEYGFRYEKGAITIPCHVADFKHVQELIDKEFESTHAVGCLGRSS